VHIPENATNSPTTDTARPGRPFLSGNQDAAPPSLLQQILRHATEHPDRPAIAADGRTVGYGELVALAERVAGRLRAAGVGRDCVVPLWLERSPELVVCALGVLLAGGAYVGMDVHEPQARVAAILADCGAPVVLTDRAHAASLPGGESAVLLVEDLGLRSAPAEPFELPEKPAVAPEDLCYVTFTSGSTGSPKGVLVEHGGVDALVAWYLEDIQLTAGDRMPQLARPSFDGWALETWPALAAGATLCLAPARLPDSPQDLIGWLTEQRVTVGFFTTALAVQLLDAVWPQTGPGAMRAMLLGGEKLHAPPARQPAFRLYHVYGPTETTMLATCGEITADTARDASPPIGRTLPGLRGHVLDEARQPVREGEPGELHLEGVQVARSYLNHPELTAQRFHTGPGGARMYATGDVVRRLLDGSFVFVGRTDDQIKLRGFRIEPGEIEAAILAVPGVSRAAVVVHEVPGQEGPSARRLVGYWSAQSATAAPSPDTLRAQLVRELPQYMVPHALVEVDEFPLTAHGKTDKPALAARPLPASGPSERTPAYASALEQSLAQVWSKVLGVAQVRRDDSFFDLGGDSLLAMRAGAEGRRQGLRFGAEDIFEAEVLSELAALLAASGEHPGV
jgi:amino acid adenylation domain-containing protein